MKKFLGLACMMALLLMGSGAQAQTAWEGQTPDTNLLYIDGTLYGGWDGQLYASGAAQAPRAAGTLPEDVWLFEAQGSLYALGQYTQSVYRWEQDAFEACGTLPEPAGENEGAALCAPVAADGKLWLVRETYAWDGMPAEPVLVSVDAQGAQAYAPLEHVWAIAPYREESLLVYTFDQTREETRPQLYALNVRTGKQTLLYENPFGTFGGMAYAAGEDAVYVVQDGCVYRCGGGKQPAGYVDGTFTGYETGRMAACYDEAAGQYIMVEEQGQIIYAKPKQEKRVLRIAGASRDDAYQAFTQKYPDVLVYTDISGTVTGERIQRAVLTQGENVDLYELEVERGYGALCEKGYCQPLDASEKIVEGVNAFYAPIREALLWNGQIMAAPVSFHLSNWVIDETLWNTLFPDREPPRTYGELLDGMYQWQEEYAQEYPDIAFLEFGGDVRLLLEEMTTQYILQYEDEQGYVCFDTDEYREALEKVLRLDLPERETEEEIDAYLGQWKLICMLPVTPIGPYEDENGRLTPITPPRFGEDGEAATPAGMRVLVLNPHSAQQDLALAYMETVMESYSPQLQAAMRADWEEPVLNRRVEKRLEEIDAQIAAIQASTGEKDEDALAQLEQRRAAWEMQKYVLTAQDVVDYHALAETMRLPVHSPYCGSDSAAMHEMTKLLDRLAEGQIDVYTCSRQMDQKARMIALEKMN